MKGGVIVFLGLPEAFLPKDAEKEKDLFALAPIAFLLFLFFATMTSAVSANEIDPWPRLSERQVVEGADVVAEVRVRDDLDRTLSYQHQEYDLFRADVERYLNTQKREAIVTVALESEGSRAVRAGSVGFLLFLTEAGGLETIYVPVGGPNGTILRAEGRYQPLRDHQSASFYERYVVNATHFSPKTYDLTSAQTIAVGAALLLLLLVILIPLFSPAPEEERGSDR